MRSDSVGIAIVTAPERDAALDWRFDPLFEVGGAEDTVLVASDIHPDRLTLDDSGRTYLLDRGVAVVRVIEPNGRIGPTLSRRGAGPGELSNPRGIDIAKDGGVLVSDRARSVLMHWSRDGALLDELRFDVTLWGYRMRRVDDGVIVMARDATTRALREILVRLHAGGTEEIAGFTWAESRPPVYPSCPGYGVERPPFFAPSLLWDARGPFVAVVTSDRYEIDIYRGSRLVRRIRRPIAPVEVTARLAEDEVGPMTIERVGCTLSAAERVRVAGHHPVFPVIAGIAIDPESRLWVRRQRPGPDADRVDILTLDGEYLGTLPEGSPFPADFSSRGRILEIVTDSVERASLRMLEVSFSDRTGVPFA